MSDDRTHCLAGFRANGICHGGTRQLAPASADASFRSYWRVPTQRELDRHGRAAGDKKTCGPWLDVGARLRAAGCMHRRCRRGSQHGFVLMEDLGTRTYLPELNAASVNALYADALDALLRMQQRHRGGRTCPLFDAHAPDRRKWN